jgi:tetratricopeptide (TPR) repeat protein
VLNQLLTPGYFRVPLRSPALRLAVFALFLLPALLLTAETVRVTTAATLADSRSLNKVRWSLRIDPGNPRLYHRLGLLAYLAAVFPEPGQMISAEDSIGFLKKAVDLSPYQAPYWLDLAATCDALHRPDCANAAFERAVKLDPMRPQLRWLAANCYLREGLTDSALTHFRQVLALDDSYASDTFRICTRVLRGSQSSLESILPPDSSPGLKLSYINSLLAEGQADVACQLWTRTLSNDPRLSFALVQPFLDGLITLGRMRQAKAIWLDLEKLGVTPRDSAAGQKNQIYNGNFEQVPLNAGFDWRYVESAYLSLNFGDNQAYEGSRCLRLDFTVDRNEEYEPVYQMVPVLPAQSYFLKAYVRSEDVTSDSGPRVHIVDPACSSCLNVSTQGTVGTTAWHPVSVAFSTGPGTEAVKISVWRQRGRAYPASISGSFWLDSVSLEAQTAKEDSTPIPVR